MRKKDAIEIIEKEITYSEGIKGTLGLSDDYERGYFAGLKQAITLIGFLPSGKIVEISVGTPSVTF